MNHDQDAHNRWVESLNDEQIADLAKGLAKLAQPIAPEEDSTTYYLELIPKGFTIAAPDSPIYTGAWLKSDVKPRKKKKA